MPQLLPYPATEEEDSGGGRNRSWNITLLWNQETLETQEAIKRLEQMIGRKATNALRRGTHILGVWRHTRKYHFESDKILTLTKDDTI